MIHKHPNGDLHLYASNGDELLKLQASEPAAVVNSSSHVLDARAEVLSREDVEAVRMSAGAPLLGLLAMLRSEEPGEGEEK